MQRKVLVIGAGIHGVSLAVELAKRGHQVTILDAREDMFYGASMATHNRIHLGYHYPRSKDTAEECRQGYNYFLKDYGDCAIFPDFYYLIHKHASKVTAEQYRSAMQDCGLPCDSEFPDERLIDKSLIEDSFKVKEGCYDIWKLKQRFKGEFQKLGIKEIYNFDIAKGELLDKDKIKLTSKNSQILEIETDLIINSTYSYTNNIQIAFSLYNNLTPYKFETTEIAVVSSKEKIPALTVMDGEFITILPYAGKDGHYLVYDKKHSIVKSEIGITYEQPQNLGTNWELMKENGLKYYPFFKDLKYEFSLYGNRPISLQSNNDDRHTRLFKHQYPIDFYSILEGKFVSAPLIAKQFVKMIDASEKKQNKGALIGHTGFIGSNLKDRLYFDDFYNSKNIQDIEGKEYDMIISCGNSAARWKVNQNPEKDLMNILDFIEHIKKVKANTFVLISTIDVFERPEGVFEDSIHGNLESNPYGRNRLYLENFIKNYFERYLIIRLPITYGHRFKKNIIYDVLNNKSIDQINTQAKVQIYNVKNLDKDIDFALKNDVRVLNIATEPIIVKDLLKTVFNLDLDNPLKEFTYDMRSNYAELYNNRKDYLYNLEETIKDLREFIKEYEIMRV